MTQLLSITSKEWAKCGRGRVISFIAMGREITDSVRHAVGINQEDYFAIKYSILHRCHTYVASFTRIKLSDWHLMDPPEGDDFYGATFFIGSRILSRWAEDMFPEGLTMTRAAGDAFNTDLMINGMIAFQRGGHNSNGELVESSFALIPKVKNLYTFAEIGHIEYDHFFRRIAREVKKILDCNATFVSRDGIVLEDKSLKWSKGALEDAKNGTHYRYGIAECSIRDTSSHQEFGASNES